VVGRIGYVCPVYSADEFDGYTCSALQSFFETTPNGVAIVVDDASANWTSEYERKLQSLVVDSRSQEVHCYHFDKWGGLTRSWNKGLSMANRLQSQYAVAGNNDVLFTPNWYVGLADAVDRHGYAMSGPLSNAPGVTANGLQNIVSQIPDYRVTDDLEYLRSISARMLRRNAGKVRVTPINGFFQFATMESWNAGRYSSQHFYKPSNPLTSSGRVNKTPLMTLNEDELQGRWRKRGMLSCVALSSFIFHYRAVSRGDKYKKGNWFRK
jgi:hypothetical protein